MIEITWKANPDSDDVVSYHIERAIVGVATALEEPFNVQTSHTMQIRVDGGDLVEFTLAGVTAGAATALEVANIIHGYIQPHGGSARVDSDGTGVIIQSNRQTDRGSIQLKGGTALTGLGLLAGEYKFQGDAVEIGEVTHPTSTFEDEDGRRGYQYRIIAENAAGEFSCGTEWFSALNETVPMSVIYGFLISSNGKPLKNEVIKFGPPINKRPSDDTDLPDPFSKNANVGVSVQLEEVLTNENGYFQLIVPASLPLRLKIDAVGYDLVVKTPTAGNATLYTKLDQDFDYESFALDGNYLDENY